MFVMKEEVLMAEELFILILLMQLNDWAKILLKKNMETYLKCMKILLDENPYKVPMKIYPAPHYTMGGLWVDYNLNE